MLYRTCYSACHAPHASWRGRVPTWNVAVRSALCGETITLGRSQSALSSGSGSVWNTSSAAPRRRPACSAARARKRSQLKYQHGSRFHTRTAAKPLQHVRSAARAGAIGARFGLRSAIELVSGVEPELCRCSMLCCNAVQCTT